MAQLVGTEPQRPWRLIMLAAALCLHTPLDARAQLAPPQRPPPTSTAQDVQPKSPEIPVAHEAAVPAVSPKSAPQDANPATSADAQDTFWYFLGKNGGLQGAGAILGSLIGFGGLIWATSRGYRNVISSQQKAADDRKAERLEQLRLDTRTLAFALIGEVTAIKEKCQIHQIVLRNLHAEWKGRVDSDKELASDTIDIRPLPPVSSIIYENNASRLGMLGYPTIEHVAELYSRLIPREELGTAPHGKTYVRHFVQFADQWITNLGLHLEFISRVMIELTLIAITGDWTAVATVIAAGKEKEALNV